MSAHTFNGQRLTPAEVAQLNRRDATFLVGAATTVIAANTLYALAGRTVLCVLIRRAFHLDHGDAKVRQRGWVAFNAALYGTATVFAWHIRHPWERRR